MVSPFRFSGLPEICFGPGYAVELPSMAERFGRRLLVVTGSKSFSGSGRGRELLDSFGDKGMDIENVRITREPSVNDVDEITARFKGELPDVVIAIGGGSVLDAGKAISAMLTVEGSAGDYLEGSPGGRLHPGTRIPLIAVPTTAGTGSEATRNAVLSTTGVPVVKRSMRHDKFIPDIAVVDPLLTAGCPPMVTAAAGLDAITQLLEAYVSSNASEMTDALALSGLEKGLSSLESAVYEEGNLGARSGMSYAALLSGIVLANAGLGAVHGFASVLGGKHSIPHGIVCGTLLGAVTRMNVQKLIELDQNDPALHKYAEAGRRICKCSEAGAEHLALCLVSWLENLTDRLKMPGLGEYGVSASEIPALAAETGLKNNPVKLDRSELEEILHSRL